MRDYLIKICAWSIVGWLVVFTACLASLEIRRELRGEIISFESDPFSPMTDLECETIARMRGWE